MIASGVAFSLAKLHRATMNTLETSKINIEAQQYGLAKAELLRSTSYDDVVSQNKTFVKNSNGFTDEVVVGSETDYSDTVKQKVCTVNVYKDGETLPRFSYKLSKLTTDKGFSNSVPAGTILPWYGEKANIPNGFALCDGTNGTPDLRDRFLVGAGTTYSLGAKGGEATHKLTGKELPSQSANVSGLVLVGSKGYASDGENGDENVSWGNVSNYYAYRGVHTGDGFVGVGKWIWSTYGRNILFYDKVDSVLSIGNDQPHENRPPYCAVFYIMKL